VNEELLEIILIGFGDVQDHDESIGKRKMSEFKRMIMQHSRIIYISNPSGLETPNKYEY
jgi:hypothetical protein